jgi:hypothetical protein
MNIQQENILESDNLEYEYDDSEVNRIISDFFVNILDKKSKYVKSKNIFKEGQFSNQFNKYILNKIYNHYNDKYASYSYFFSHVHKHKYLLL